MYADYFGIFSIKTFCITSLHSIHFLKHLFDTLHQPTTALYIDKALRIRLKDATFMCFPDHVNRSPNLLDQEVRSITHIIALSLQLLSYANDDDNNNNNNEDDVKEDAFVTGEQWLQQYGTLSVHRYMTSQNSALPMDLIAAYKPAVLCLLGGLHYLPEPIFHKHLQWIAPLVVQLVACDDKDIRQLVAVLLESQVFPLIVPSTAAAAEEEEAPVVV